MSYTLKNEYLSASFNLKGAELCSLKNKDGDELLWQADASFWGRHAPILFPIVGRLKDDTYYYNGQAYKLSQHGFARDLDFELTESSETKAIFELKSNSLTLEKYPFDFVLRLHYTLSKNALTIGYEVVNPSDADMYFSIGAHPAFICPLDSNKKRSDYQFTFDKPVTASTYLLEEGLQNNATESAVNHQRTLKISDNLFDKDALVFKAFPSDEVGIAEIGKESFLKVQFNGFPFLGLWSKSQDAPFVCIEPWLGIADNINSSQDLTEKEGIIKLSAKEVFEASYKMIIS